MGTKIDALENALQIAKLYVKSLELELGKITSERDEAVYNLDVANKEIAKLKRLEAGELRQFRKDLRYSNLESEKKKLEKDVVFWRNKALAHN